jgi:hypothetical protein
MSVPIPSGVVGENTPISSAPVNMGVPTSRVIPEKPKRKPKGKE